MGRMMDKGWGCWGVFVRSLSLLSEQSLESCWSNEMLSENREWESSGRSGSLMAGEGLSASVMMSGGWDVVKQEVGSQWAIGSKWEMVLKGGGQSENGRRRVTRWARDCHRQLPHRRHLLNCSCHGNGWERVVEGRYLMWRCKC